MTDTQLKELYRTACHGKGFEPNDGQFKVWKQTLGWCEEADLAQALVWYFSDNAAFPMPAELKTLSERARRERVSRAAQKTELVGWFCPECGVHLSGFLDPSDHAPRACKGVPRTGPTGEVCGAIMVEMYRCAASDAIAGYQRK